MADPVPAAQKILKENDRLAIALRERFTSRGLLCLNFISSPGSGKTALLERTLRELPRDVRAAVVTGDIQTDNDARRLARAGYPVKQISTGGICHLDASMVTRALADWDLDDIDLLFVENVGNLVCPTSFDLGEHAKIVLLSVTEGDDKPEKYPGIFRKAELMLITKADLLPYVPFDIDQARALARGIHPGIQDIVLSTQTGDGFTAWRAWLAARLAAARLTAAVATRAHAEARR
jgi:hydrogenase nickel incorporation protein HypB